MPAQEHRLNRELSRVMMSEVFYAKIANKLLKACETMTLLFATLELTISSNMHACKLHLSICFKK